MLGFIDVSYKRFQSSYPRLYFIYDSKGRPYLIDIEEQKWMVNPIIQKVMHRGGTYLEINDTYYLNYEEPVFYR